MFIYCDDPSHARRVPVTNFYELPGGGWHEEPASRAATSDVGAGHHLIGDKLGEAGWALDSDVSGADVRTRYKLVCRKCKGTGGQGAVDAKGETLHRLLDGWRKAGVSELALSVIGANLSEKRN